MLYASTKSTTDKLIRSFGRIKSRKLSLQKETLLNNLLPTYFLEKYQKNNFSQNILEIGYGFGDFLFQQASNNQHAMFYGCEPHLNGIINLLAKLQKQPLYNLKINNYDVRLFLQTFPDNFFQQIFILFPDPWPKIKHHKRRLINSHFLDFILAKKIAPNGKLIIVTDHCDYATWILSRPTNHFIWQATTNKDWQHFPPYWHETKYQLKAKNEGRECIYLEFQPTSFDLI
jgi:tRNA (guanine-N7-)-methyltransferase